MITKVCIDMKPAKQWIVWILRWFEEYETDMKRIWHHATMADTEMYRVGILTHPRYAHDVASTSHAIRHFAFSRSLYLLGFLPRFLLVPSGKHTKNYGTSPFLMGKSTISMVIFNSFLLVYQRVTSNPKM